MRVLKYWPAFRVDRSQGGRGGTTKIEDSKTQDPDREMTERYYTDAIGITLDELTLNIPMSSTIVLLSHGSCWLLPTFLRIMVRR